MQPHCLRLELAVGRDFDFAVEFSCSGRHWSGEVRLYPGVSGIGKLGTIFLNRYIDLSYPKGMLCLTLIMSVLFYNNDSNLP